MEYRFNSLDQKVQELRSETVRIIIADVMKQQ